MANARKTRIGDDAGFLLSCAAVVFAARPARPVSLPMAGVRMGAVFGGHPLSQSTCVSTLNEMKVE